MDWVLFAQGQQAASARALLDELCVELENVRGRSPGLNATVFADLYLRWVEGADRMLRDVFLEDYFVRGLYSDRYWRIRDAGDGTARPFPLVDNEIQDQLKRLRELSAQIVTYTLALQAPEGVALVVPDTNVYVHYRRFNELPWVKLLGVPRVRLLVPLVVVDELDDLKNRGGKRGERASGVIKTLRGLEETGDGVFKVRQDVDMKYFIEPLGHVRRSNSDDEIVSQAAYASSLSGALTVVTGDYGMQLRASNVGLSQFLVPDEYGLSLDAGA